MTEQYRASKITIEIPKEDSEPWVHLTVNKMYIDAKGNIVNDIPRYDYISKPLSEVAFNEYTLVDPVMGGDITISGYGIANAITAYVDKHIKEKYGS